MTNILALPHTPIVSDVTVATNEDWRQGFAFETAGNALVIRGNNIGSGIVYDVQTVPGAPVGTIVLTITGLSPLPTYSMLAPNGEVIGLGSVVPGVLNQVSGISFMIAQGSAPFAIGDSFSIVVVAQPLDISGIYFSISVKQRFPQQSASGLWLEPVTVLKGNTVDGILSSSGYQGIVSVNFLQEQIARAGVGEYDYDILAVDVEPSETVKRRCVAGKLSIVSGQSCDFGT